MAARKEEVHEMKLSAPVYRLKREAKDLSRESQIPLHAALDRIAAREGFGAWSLLAAKLAESSAAIRLYEQLRPGELVLPGARPGHGKTLLSLELAATAMKAGHRSIFFSLEYTEADCRDRFSAVGIDLGRFEGLFEFDGSDSISAGHILSVLAAAPEGTLAIVDYLQLLDQRRDTPELGVQIRSLKTFAQEREITIVFISQIDRSYNPAVKAFPDLSDVRLPNPADLTLSDRTWISRNVA